MIVWGCGLGFIGPSHQLKLIKSQQLSDSETPAYFVSLIYGGEVICGGAHIKPGVILTAAHCVLDEDATHALLSYQLAVLDIN